MLRLLRFLDKAQDKVHCSSPYTEHATSQREQSGPPCRKEERQQLLESMPAVFMEGVELDKVITAEYLGHLFTGNGDCSEDVDY
jgi:hypothetical protein